MTHPSPCNHIETNSPGAIAKDPISPQMAETKFLFINFNYLLGEKQF